MKYIVIAIILTAASAAYSQNTTVRCKTPEGQIITIAYPGMCPAGTSPL